MRYVFFLACLALVALAPRAHAQYGPGAPSGPAIKGYDVVAYFTLEKATLGKPSITAEYEGATWRFVSARHKELFLANPKRYLPQYNGWCAFAAARGYAAEVDPKNGWAVHRGKLYLNYSRGVNRSWRRKADTYITQADERWPQLRTSIANDSASIPRR